MSHRRVVSDKIDPYFTQYTTINMKMMKGLMENKKVHEEKIEFFNSLGVAESFLTIKSSKNPKVIKKIKKSDSVNQ